MEKTTTEQQVGERIRALRTKRGLSVRTLATRAGFSPSFISQVETGQASPSIASLERIAGVLGITLGQFFRDSGQLGPAIVPANERLQLTSNWSRATIEALGPVETESRIVPVLITLLPGGRSGSQPSAHAAEEFFFVLEGELLLTVEDQVHPVGPGTSVTLPPGVRHQWANAGSEAARIIVVSSRSGY